MNLPQICWTRQEGAAKINTRFQSEKRGFFDPLRVYGDAVALTANSGFSGVCSVPASITLHFPVHPFSFK